MKFNKLIKVSAEGVTGKNFITFLLVFIQNLLTLNRFQKQVNGISQSVTDLITTLQIGA